jgi:hypothetical protein
MCDPEGIYSFKWGNEYRGSFRTCSKLTNKYGCFEGPGILKIADVATFEGYFKNGNIQGPGKIKFSNGKAPFEQIWENTSIDDLHELIKQIN